MALLPLTLLTVVYWSVVGFWVLLPPAKPIRPQCPNRCRAVHHFVLAVAGAGRTPNPSGDGPQSAEAQPEQALQQRAQRRSVWHGALRHPAGPACFAHRCRMAEQHNEQSIVEGTDPGNVEQMNCHLEACQEQQEEERAQQHAVAPDRPNPRERSPRSTPGLWGRERPCGEGLRGILCLSGSRRRCY